LEKLTQHILRWQGGTQSCYLQIVLVIHLLYAVIRYEVADWVKFRRNVTSPAFGWQGAGPRSIGFVQSIVDNDHLVVSFCTGEARVLTSEVIKVIPLNRGQHVQLKPDVSEPR
jgi:hypothetical protein